MYLQFGVSQIIVLIFEGGSFWFVFHANTESQQDLLMQTLKHASLQKSMGVKMYLPPMVLSHESCAKLMASC